MRSARGEPPGSRVVTTSGAARFKPLTQALDLRGLACALPALERDEAALRQARDYPRFKDADARRTRPVPKLEKAVHGASRQTILPPRPRPRRAAGRAPARRRA